MSFPTVNPGSPLRAGARGFGTVADVALSGLAVLGRGCRGGAGRVASRLDHLLETRVEGLAVDPQEGDVMEWLERQPAHRARAGGRPSRRSA